MTTRRDGRAAAVDSPELDLRTLPPAAEFVVETRNTRYRCVMLDAGEQKVLVAGGRHFAHATRARIEGATVGASPFAVGRIKVGLSMELSAGDRRIVTSPVYSITLDAA